MNETNQDRLKKLLRQAVPPIEVDPEPRRDLWPSVLGGLGSRTSTPWFDWALVAGLVALAAIFPTAIPVLLYYL